MFTRMLIAPVALLSLLSFPLIADEDTSSTEQQEEAVKVYPSDTCLVSGEKLGSMGDPYVFTSDGYEVKLCCKPCIKDFNARKDEYLAKLKELHEEAAESDTSPTEESDHGKHDHHDHDH